MKPIAQQPYCRHALPDRTVYVVFPDKSRLYKNVKRSPE